MDCPFCYKEDTKVIDSRLMREGNEVRRRRECECCKERFTTYETAELALPRVVKRDGKRVPFSETKLRTGIMRALEKRPVSMAQIDSAMAHLIRKAVTSGDREIASANIGEWVMEELHELDQVAYVRFASVYRSFQDINEFQREITKLTKHAKQKTKPKNRNPR